MEGLIRELCALSILCGVALSLTPEGSGRRVMSFACSLALLSCVLGGIKTLDWDVYSMEISRYRESEQTFLEQSGEIRDDLDRRVIEAECRAYVLEQAVRLGIPIRDAAVRVDWSTEGLWVPYKATVYGNLTDQEKGRLARILETELGIPGERQEWNEND